MTDKIQLIKEGVNKLIEKNAKHPKDEITADVYEYALQDVISLIDSITKDSASDCEDDFTTRSEDLNEASWNYSDREGVSYGQRYAMQIDFKAGADWQQRQDEKRFGWHDAKKEQPPMDEEVIVLTSSLMDAKNLDAPRKICFGHIVDKEICVDYDGWNIPGVAYWMYDPKLKEDK